ncbi:polyprenyl synthetase family protein [Methylorubrum sp. B1-46]|uniref:polyprenyl synthetase family protein n=1 Tax=Methylorubrum sp. B1-46 TaxID=2897334 RepID=UPI0009EF6AEE|nr:polyprenyl synthetase family protein [Methylorubrum sp. B1-46]UGB26189.1 polyprenyl synthetase family protein [Methylorubrum sp. B1-46]
MADNFEMEFVCRHAATKQAVEAFLAKHLCDEADPGEMARAPRLMEAMRYAVFGRGKRLRSFLTIETARMLGGSEVLALATGAGVELAHCYSLVHDDLPALDDDDMHRGKPAVHRAFDEATAILAGNALQALAFEVIADPRWQPNPAIRAELVLGLARASGPGGMIGGQLLDLSAEGRFGAADMDIDGTLRMQTMKTGMLLAFSVEAGALIGGADFHERDALQRYGRALGQAVQIADDILDRVATPEVVGKATSKDRGLKRASLADCLDFDRAQAECYRLVAICDEAVSQWNEAAAVLRQAARFAVARKA